MSSILCILETSYYYYGKKNKDPFYVKLGSLNYSTIGYGNIVDSYTNMIEYPTYKRWGGELAFKGDKFGLELLVNNFKEVAMDNPGMMIASRLSYRPLKRLEVFSQVHDFFS